MAIPKDAAYWKSKLQMQSHPEGGAFVEIYRSPLTIDKESLPAGFTGSRSACTSIYFLLEQGSFSAFHRIKSDELWHFYEGGRLIVYEIHPDGRLQEHWLGKDLEKAEQLQCCISAGSWFASIPAADSAYALAGCTVAPGFDFDDFELADRKSLTAQYPRHKFLIEALTH